MVRKDQKEIKFIKRQDSEHPYCTNWPMTKKKRKKKWQEKFLKKLCLKKKMK